MLCDAHITQPGIITLIHLTEQIKYDLADRSGSQATYTQHNRKSLYVYSNWQCANMNRQSQTCVHLLHLENKRKRDWKLSGGYITALLWISTFNKTDCRAALSRFFWQRSLGKVHQGMYYSRLLVLLSAVLMFTESHSHNVTYTFFWSQFPSNLWSCLGPKKRKHVHSLFSLHLKAEQLILKVSGSDV